MKATLRKIAFGFSIVGALVTNASGQSVYQLTDFVERNPPADTTEEWHNLNYSSFEFDVSNKNGKLVISNSEEKDETTFKVPGGELVAINLGEFGGKLVFKPSDTTKPEVKIKSGNPRYIFQLKDKIYCLDGLSHLGFRLGEMDRIDNENGMYSYKQIIDFKDEPSAYTVYHDTILVATSQGFCIVHDFMEENLFDSLFWGGLYPNSVTAIDNKHVYVGIRGGYVKIDLVAKKLKFYEYKKNAE